MVVPPGTDPEAATSEEGLRKVACTFEGTVVGPDPLPLDTPWRVARSALDANARNRRSFTRFMPTAYPFDPTRCNAVDVAGWGLKAVS
jgi:hypothetical protein